MALETDSESLTQSIGEVLYKCSVGMTSEGSFPGVGN